MFLFDPGFANEGDNVQQELDRILERAQAALIGLSRWDERKLAYEIKRRKRGVHVIAYFSAPAESIRGIERDVQLSDHILRVLILRADHVTEEQMKSPIPSPSEATRRFGDEWGGAGRGGRGPGRRGGPDRDRRREREEREKAVATKEPPAAKPDETPVADAKEATS
jgi:small subunit ribosomal protein S6